MRAIDAAPEDATFDASEYRALVGDDAVAARAFEDADKDAASGRASRASLLRAFGWHESTVDASKHLPLDWGRGDPAPEPTTFDRAAAAAVNAAVEAESAGTPKHHELDPETARAQRRAAYVHSETRESLTATDPETGREIRFAFWRPSAPKPDGPDGEKHESPWSNGPRGIYLLFHGGGFVFGDAAGQNDERLERMAANLGVVVMVPDYRKAPENPYPAALEDCESAARWCEANAAAHFDMHEQAGGTLIMSGESAGANLCASVLQRRRRAHDSTSPSSEFPWRFANLVYGIFDLAGTPSVSAFGERRLVETAEDLRYFARCYCPDEAARGAADASPLLGDLRGMPPAAFTVGTEDALLDDTLLMREAWLAAGVEATLDVWPEGPHGVGHFGPHATTQLGLACRDRVHERIATVLDARSDIRRGTVNPWTYLAYERAGMFDSDSGDEDDE